MRSREFEKELKLMDDETIQAELDQLEGIYSLTGANYQLSELDDQIRLAQVYHFIKDHKACADLLEHIKPSLDEKINTRPDSDLLGLLTEWHFLIIRYRTDNKKDFAAWPNYKELIHAFETANLSNSVDGLQAKLQTLYNFEQWREKGGDLESLDAEDLSVLEGLEEGLLDEIDAAIEERVANANWEDAYSLNRIMHRYFTFLNEANDAIYHLKEMVKLAPKKPDAHPADETDLIMDLAKFYFQHKNYAVAKKYFSKALEQYTALGDEFELFSMQAESWVTECTQRA